MCALMAVKRKYYLRLTEARNRSGSIVKREPMKGAYEEKVTYPDTIYSKISAKLIDVEQLLHQVSQESNSAQKSSDIALSRSRSVVAHGVPEPFMKGESIRKVL